jgi:cysteine-rich repeat protein
MKTALLAIAASSGLLLSMAACSTNTDEELTSDESAVTDPCGNGVRDQGEQCDDGNKNNLDGCNSKCQFEQVHRMNSIAMQFNTDSFCTSNAIGGAIKSVAQSQISDALNSAVGDGSISILLAANNATDPTGVNGTFSLSSYVGAPANAGQLGLDAVFTASKASLAADLSPLVSMNASSSSSTLSAGPGNVAFSLALAGPAVDLSLSNARMKASVGAASAPGGHLASEHLDPSLQTFATLTNGQMCGDISASSLAAMPVPEQLTSGSTSCSQGYTQSNSMLDVLVGGCKVFIITALGATQPDKAASGVPVAGAGAPYKLTTSGTKVTGCKDKSGASVDLDACLKSASYSAAFKFTSQRVAVRGTSD